MQRRQSNKVSQVQVLCLLAAASCCLTGAAGALLAPLGQQLFELSSEVSLRELSGEAKPLSYRFSSQLKISSVWSSVNLEDQLLKLELSESKVQAGKSRLVQLPDRPFYISLANGQPKQVIAHSSKDQSLLNLERGIASLLQLQFDGSAELDDVSGHCKVSYEAKSSTRIEKTKTDCSHWDLRVHYRAEAALGVARHSEEKIKYELSAEGALLSAESVEEHRLALAAKQDVGSLITASLKLKQLGEGEQQEQLPFASLEEAINSLLDWYRVFELAADVDGAISELKEQSLAEQLEKSTEHWQSSQLGKSSQALAFAQLLPLARIAQQSEFLELLKLNEAMLPQLVDLLGAVQTFEAHNATFSHLYRGAATSAEAQQLLEKYLQSLAVATHPERAILSQLYELLSEVQAIAKLKPLRESILLTLATLSRQSQLDDNDELLNQLRGHLVEGLRSSSKDDKLLFIRALQNLQDVNTIEELLSQAQAAEAESKLSVAALQALKAFPVAAFKEQQRRQFAAIFYQQRRRFDSSARTLALDVLLAMRPNPAQLGQLVDYLASNDRQFEIKTYALQKLRLLAEQCPRFRALLSSLLAERPRSNNYHVLGQKGLTTVLRRQLSVAPGFNESLLSTQEVHQGILKRGSVEFLLHAGRAEPLSSFKLGVYTAGLGGLVGDGDEEQSDDDELPGEETVTAGMELSVQGAQLRPLVFFNGQTELMGHVWGGSASESTPAYQATTLAQDHELYIILSSGATLHWRLLGARSVDLNGKVGFSLWNRNAQTEIQQNTGSAVVGHVAVGFTFAKLEQDFTVTHEPKLSLQADLDFYSGIKLCMQLQRPEQQLTNTNSKSVYLTNVDRGYAKHLRSTRLHKSPGCTFALNQKNNEMCNMIHN